MDSGLSSLIKVPGGLGIDYGCGIGPKVVLSDAKDGMVAILSQRKDKKEFSLYEIEMKWAILYFLRYILIHNMADSHHLTALWPVYKIKQVWNTGKGVLYCGAVVGGVLNGI